MEEKTKLKSFINLMAWQEGHKLVLLIYNIIKKFPRTEKFGLASHSSRVIDLSNPARIIP
jgi:hypothetical protein